MKWFSITVCEIIILLIQLTTQQSQIVKDVCGKRGARVCPVADSINTRVTGGSKTCAEKVPWNVLVENRQTVKDGEVEPYCGGVLITEKHVLSAAHCFWSNQNQFGVCPRQFENSDAQTCSRNGRGCPKACTRVPLKDIKLHLGLTNRLKPDSSIMRDVAKIEIHPGWDRGTKLNDILEGHDLVVLTMTRSVDIFGSRIKPACLPDLNYYPPVNSDAEVSGFGAKVDKSDGSKSYPFLVQSADLSIKSLNTCSDVWGTSGNQICAFGRLSPTIDTGSAANLQIADSCNGDSGGGLTQTRRDGREMVIGTISFGEPECGRRNGKPGVYTNIAEPDNLQWIKNKIKDESFGNSGAKACFATNNKRCVFPFKFQGELFASCTTKNDPDNKPWCSTQVDEQRNHVTGEGEWGHCPSSCLVDILSTPGSPNTIETPGATWSEWSSCSKSCGGGIRTRTNSLCPRSVTNCVSSERQECSTVRCPTISIQRPTTARPTDKPSSGGSDVGSNEDDFQTSMWIIDGTEEPGWIEQFTPGIGGRGKSVAIEKLPFERQSAIGAQVGDNVYVCGGSSGTFGDSTVHSECFVKKADSARSGRWKIGPSMEYKTSHAASASFGRKIYVFGGYKKPVCDKTPQVQVFNADSQKWSSSFFMDPPDFIGAFNCAAASNSRIYITGGYYERSYVDSNKCKEEPSGEELTASNRDKDNYQKNVLIFSPKNGIWSKGPEMMHRRRNHGCSIVTIGGQQGLLVAGGYNPEEFFLDSVEFLSFSAGGRSWQKLSSFNTARGSRLGLFQVRNLIYALSGEPPDGTSVEVMNAGARSSSWTSLGNRLVKKKSYSLFIPVSAK